MSTTTINAGDIEISHDGQPESQIWWRPTTWDDAEWQAAGLQCADVVGGWQDDNNVVAAVQSQLGED